MRALALDGVGREDGDPAPLGGAQQRHGRPDAPDGGHRAEGEGGVPPASSRSSNRPAAGPDRVHQDVQRAPALADLAEALVDGVRVGHVDADADRIGAARGPQGGAVSSRAARPRAMTATRAPRRPGPLPPPAPYPCSRPSRRPSRQRSRVPCTSTFPCRSDRSITQWHRTRRDRARTARAPGRRSSRSRPGRRSVDRGIRARVAAHVLTAVRRRTSRRIRCRACRRPPLWR